MAWEWERFMTEQDKAHDEMWGKKENFGFGEKPALVLIDIYYGVLGFKREPLLEQIKTIPGGMGLEGWEAVDRTVELLAAARKHSIPVIHVTKLDKNGIIGWGRKMGKRMSLPEGLKDRASEIVEEVAPIEGEMIIHKAAPSAFQGTVLPFMLRKLGVDTIIACGESTSGCVRATVVDGTTYRYNMGVVAECCFDRTQMSHHVNLFDMHQKYADVIHLPEAIAYFEKVGSNFKQSVSS
ncbi:isochorismatase family protein [Paenibacillus abyssi]|uniref:Hydrolase n=1 Tax=Paenibacillus abyssi TaxID=1340531 RepID=A0A917CWG5_9BACL|nr:isochorismatase family protein [Paenibacillus abyssi]GGG00718.1 hydrolase [Paenibacillus abyssi]